MKFASLYVRYITQQQLESQTYKKKLQRKKFRVQIVKKN